jgi:hypothetical protein
LYNEKTGFFERGSLFEKMTIHELPAPTGTPQLVVTRKGACILDAHEANKILLRVTIPKNGICSSGVNTTTKGPWSLTLNDSTVYCRYEDGHVRGLWRAELLPPEQQGNKVTALITGYQDNKWSLGQIMAVVWTLFWVAIGSYLIIIAMNECLLQDSSRMVHMNECLLMMKLQDVGGVPAPTGPQGAIGPKGVQGPEGPRGGPIGDLGDLGPPVSNGNGIVFDTLPPTTTFPVFRALSADDDLPTADTLTPGTELASGKELRLGDFNLLFSKCMIHVIGIRDPDPELDRITYTPARRLMSGEDETLCTLSMQRDGNLVIYHPKKGAVWASRDHLNNRLCMLGITVHKDGYLDCQIERPPSPPPSTVDMFRLGSQISGDERIKLGNYQLGLDGCDIRMTGLGSQRYIAQIAGSGCRLAMQFDGNMVLYHPHRGIVWSSIARNMPACTKGMTANSKGFLNCVD